MRLSLLFCGVLLALPALHPLGAQEPPAAPAPVATAAAEPELEKTIRATAAAFAAAFNEKDAEKVAAFWTPDGEYVNDRGQTFHGRPAIAAEYAAFFAANPALTMEVEVESVRRVAAGLVVEEGSATLVSPEAGPLTTSRYTTVHVQQDGDWLAASVRESQAVPVSNYPFLAELEWLVGQWVAEGDAIVLTSCRWTANRHFLLRTFTVSEGDATTLSGMQIVGWDPTVGRVASWIFDSEGGHGYGIWTQTADGWRVDSHGTLRDGTPTSATNFVTRIDEDTVGWQSVQRRAGTVDLPDTERVVVKRVPMESPAANATEEDAEGAAKEEE